MEGFGEKSTLFRADAPEFRSEGPKRNDEASDV
jgi:hypothetical protein